jgi:hypothetical protein
MERHAGTFAYWRLRHLCQSEHHAWPQHVHHWVYPPRPGPRSPREGRLRRWFASDPSSPPVPLRYLLADRATDAIKRGLGPAYAPLRAAVGYAGRICSRIGQPDRTTRSGAR